MDMQGVRFGRWSVQSVLPASGKRGGRRMAECRCDCGAVKAVRLSHLQSGASTSCGCYSRQATSGRCKYHIAAGNRYGRWVVLAADGRDRRRKLVAGRCDCGTVRTIRQDQLFNGDSRSCGCLQRERSAEASTKHGLSRQHVPEYVCWCQMRQRCSRPTHPEYKNYGGRGISVCLQWQESFAQFLKDVGRRPSDAHSIERIDVNGSYEPENVRWATAREQCRNQRRSVRLTINGETKTIAEWAERAGITYNTLYGRLKRGWAPQVAITGHDWVPAR